MNSRLYSLCKMFPKIEERIVGVDWVHVVGEEMRWDEAVSALERERKQSLSWLLGVCSLEQETK